MKVRAVVLAVVLALGSVMPARAQFFEFGQNKIQYRHFEWRVLSGKHVDLYFYPAEADLAPVALAYAEASYDTLALQFGHEVPARIPLIVYASHVDFEQTNVLPFTPPEGLLGATDFLKRRVTMPFRGNLSEFRHTLRHELVHVFQLSLSAEAYHEAPRATRVSLPLWWTEGLAELWSGGEDARDEMILRDLTLTGRLPTISQLEFVGSFIVYPLGGRIHRWLADTYGDWRVALMYRELARHESFEKAIESIYGKTLAQLSDEFQLAMRRSYYPTATTRAPMSVLARRLAQMAIKPTPIAGTASDGDDGELAYLSPATGYLTIYRRGIREDARARSVAAAGRSEGLESFHPFESRLDASREGLLLFSAKYHDRDALIVWDLARKRIAGRYQFPGLVSILSPAWLPDGSGIVFSGLSESGTSDLYRMTMADGALAPLTRDRYQDVDPAPSPDGRSVVFASDRTAGGLDGAVNLFVLDVATGSIRQLTSGNWVDETPAWGTDGRIYFTSGRDGVLNVFSVDTLGNGRRETSAWTGAFDAAPLPDSSGMLVGGFQSGGYNVYRYGVDSLARAETFGLDSAPAHSAWQWQAGPDTLVAVAGDEPYRRRYTLDFAAGGLSITPGYGGSQGIAFLMSDLLGDNLIYGSVGSFQGKDFGSFFENINATAIYLNQVHRVNWGLGAFRTRGRAYEGELTPTYDETATGGLALLRYPLSRYSRIEGTFVAEHSNRVDFSLPTVDEPRRVGWIASNYVSFVRDNSLWIPSGPIDGLRFSVTAGIASDFSNGRFDSFLLSGDLRRYFRLARRVTFATRAFGFYGGGDRPRRTNIGGTTALRGYPNYGYIVGSKAWMLNGELRFPVLNHLVLGLPFGDVVFPEFQGALFFDVGRAWFERNSLREPLGSYGASVRLALAPLAVIRMDVGHRFSGNDFAGYGLSPQRRGRGFLSFFFGYNY